jgi:predicted nucleic-acid-binding protein
MIGLDTNVLVRYIVRDDDEQSEAATRLIESKCTADNPGLVSSIVMCELTWVLTRGYGYRRDMVGRVIRRILLVQELQVENAEMAWQAVRLFEQGKADFADYLIGVSNREGKAEVTYTFDRRAVESDLFKIVPARTGRT